MAEIDRSAISRARFFLDKAKECMADKHNEFEAYMEASFLFARSEILRIEYKYEKHPNFKPWWNSLLKNTTLEFIRKERNIIVHKHPPKTTQIIIHGAIQQITPASALYCYETNDEGSPINPILTLTRCIEEVERTVECANSLFL